MEKPSLQLTSHIAAQIEMVKLAPENTVNAFLHLFALLGIIQNIPELIVQDGIARTL